MEFFADTNVWVSISFLVFVGLAYKFGRESVLSTLDKRVEDVRKEIETAESLRVEAQELFAQYQRKYKDADTVAEGIVSEAKARAESMRRKAEQELKEAMERREAQLSERIRYMEIAARERLRASAAEMALIATSEVIASTLGKQDQDRLFDESLEKVSKALN